MSSSASDTVAFWFLELKKVRHPKIKQIVSTIGRPVTSIPKWPSLDEAVIHIIVSQMLSSVAARSIVDSLYRRFRTAENILDWASRSRIKHSSYGLSVRKRKALAHWYNCDKRRLYASNDPSPSYDSVKSNFSNVWGLGPWSIDMLAIFFFKCHDVWPRNDVTITKLSDLLFKAKYPTYVRGYESITCICLWELLDRKLIQRAR